MNDAVPDQERGISSDVITLHKLEGAKEAKDFYKICKERLLNINRWTELCDTDATQFTLTNKFGIPKAADAQVDDHIRLGIPGPENEGGKGFDWVIIEEIGEEISENQEFCFIRVRPASNPCISSDETMHFFKDAATSTFMVKRDGDHVFAEVHGRNEIPNVEAFAIKDKVRNVLVSLGSMLGLSAIQWKLLTKGIING